MQCNKIFKTNKLISSQSTNQLLYGGKWKGHVGRAFKEDGSQVAQFLNRAPMFDWYVVQWLSNNKHHKDTCSKQIGLRLQIIIITPHSTVNTFGRTYVSKLEINKHKLPKINKHRLPEIVTKSWEVRFSIRFLHMFCCRFANATRDVLCESGEVGGFEKWTKWHLHTLIRSIIYWRVRMPAY
jgi:hypothetical protein